MNPMLTVLLACLLPPVAEERTQAFQVAGKVKEVLVKPGDQVKVGQVLARLDDVLTVKQVELCRLEVDRHKRLVEAARAEYAVTKAICDRDNALFQKNVIPREERDISQFRMMKADTEVEKAKTSYEKAKVTLEMAQLELRYHTLTSDFDGTVTTLHKHAKESTEAHKSFITLRVSEK